MQFSIPDQLLAQAGLSENDFRLEIALIFYQRRSVSLGKAAELAGINRFALQKEMARRQIPINYDEQALRHDIEGLER